MGSPIAGYQGALLITSPPSVGLTNDTLNNPSSDGVTWVESVAAHRYWDRSVAAVIQSECDEIQSVVITGGPTGGTFTLTSGVFTTLGIAYNATASVVQSALNLALGASSVTCTGGPLPATPVTIEFSGNSLQDVNHALMTANSTGLTGGASPTAVPSRVQAGQTWTAVTPASIQHVGGTIVLSAAYQGTNVGVRAQSANYFPYTVLLNITKWQYDGQMAFQDTTALQGAAGGGGGSGFKSFQPLLLEGTLQIDKWWVPETSEGYIGDLVAGTYLLFSGVAGTGNRYEGYGYLKKVGLKMDVAKLVEHTLDFQFDQAFYQV